MESVTLIELARRIGAGHTQGDSLQIRCPQMNQHPLQQRLPDAAPPESRQHRDCEFRHICADEAVAFLGSRRKTDPYRPDRDPGEDARDGKDRQVEHDTERLCNQARHRQLADIMQNSPRRTDADHADPLRPQEPDQKHPAITQKSPRKTVQEGR